MVSALLQCTPERLVRELGPKRHKSPKFLQEYGKSKLESAEISPLKIHKRENEALNYHMEEWKVQSLSPFSALEDLGFQTKESLRQN